MTAAGGKLTWLFDLVEVLVEKDDQVAMELQKILDKKKSPLKPPALLKQASEQVTVDQRNSCCCSDEQSSESAETTAGNSMIDFSMFLRFCSEIICSILFLFYIHLS